MSEQEQGLELHDWETRWSELDALLEDDPAAALPDACDFVERTLEEADVPTGAVAGENEELLVPYRAARDTADRVERGEDVDPGDIGMAVENLRAVRESVRPDVTQ